MPTSLLESSLFENAIQGARGQIVAQLPGDGDASWFRAMLELAVAALRRDETPAVVVQHPQHLADFHRASISGPVPPVRPARRGDTTRIRHRDGLTCVAARTLRDVAAYLV